VNLLKLLIGVIFIIAVLCGVRAVKANKEEVI
jgi:hypothetical protein